MDNYNILANSCDSTTPELELVETVNEILSYAQNDQQMSVILGCNRDLFPEDSLSEAFYREFKNSP